MCGTDAAVRKDIESVAAARSPGYPSGFEETTVSGPGASLSIVDAFEAVVRPARGRRRDPGPRRRRRPSLLPWSTEEVCRAVAACPVPVVSAIGHEGDRPLCDEVADLRCGTPSLAATAVVPDLTALAGAVDAALRRAGSGLSLRMDVAGRRVAGVDPGRSLAAGVDRAAGRLERAGLRLARVHPGASWRAGEARLAGLGWRRLWWERLGRADGRMAADGRHLGALSPQRTLDRGYAVVTRRDGSVVRRASAVQPGDSIGIRLAAGRLAAAVTEIHPLEGEETHDD